MNTNQTTPPNIEFRDDGFDLIEGDRRKEVRWEAVREIVAYRLDPQGRDLMCLGFRISASNDFVEAHEELPHYPQLLEAMYEAFPKIDREWWKGIAQSLGSNRTTIHGLPLADQLHEPTSAAARFLLESAKRNAKARRRKQIRSVLVAAAVLLGIAFAQRLICALLCRWANSGWDDFLAMLLLPMTLVVFCARVWPKPKILFAVLGGFYFYEAILYGLWGWQDGSLAAMLLQGRLQYVFLIGLEILVGIGVMLLPDKHAAGTIPSKPFLKR
jgi:hypothetical protein